MKLDSVLSLQAELLDELEHIPVVLTATRDATPLGADRAEVGATRRGRVMIAHAAARTSDVDPQARTIAIGVSRRGRNDYRLAVRLQRRALAAAPQVEAIRKRAKGEVDIRYIGRLTKRAVPMNERRRRPLRIGLSIGHFRITAGTLGAFVKLRSGGQVRMLSNNHVFADENRGKAGDVIIQPGDADDGRTPADRVGALAEYRKLSRSKPNVIDAALAKVDSRIKYDSKALHGHGQLKGLLLDPELITGTVEKVGRTTGHTKGRVTAFNVRNVVVGFDIGNLRFDDQIEIEGTGAASFSDGGDSGSLIYTSAGHLAVGLLFAGGDVGGSNNAGLTYANPIRQVLDRLKVDLLH
jgi:hypothetical protein